MKPTLKESQPAQSSGNNSEPIRSKRKYESKFMINIIFDFEIIKVILFSKEKSKFCQELLINYRQIFV